MNLCTICSVEVPKGRRKFCSEKCVNVQRRLDAITYDATHDRSEYYRQRHLRDRERRNARALARYYRIKADPVAYEAHKQQVRKTNKVNGRARKLAAKAGIPISEARRLLNAWFVADVVGAAP